MRASLRHEVAAFLLAHGPSTVSEIRMGVRSRRVDVDAVLAQGRFSVVERPEGGSARATYFNVSERVQAKRSGPSRADLMLEVLTDGRWHSRDEIWRRAGRVFYTNNAAVELRGRGHTVEYDRAGDSYRLVSLAAPESTSTPSEPRRRGSGTDGTDSGAASERRAA